LQKISGAQLGSADRNVERARYLRSHLSKHGNGGPASAGDKN
jgi:hypothetical protein